MTGGLRVEFEAEAKIRATVDVTGYFLGMDRAEQIAYLKWSDRNWWDGDPVHKPVAYLTSEIDGHAEVHTGMGGRRPVICDESELEEWDAPRIQYGGRWSEENYAALLAAVPWLAAADRLDELSDEERAARDEELALEKARIPHDWDVPLFDLPARAAS